MPANNPRADVTTTDEPEAPPEPEAEPRVEAEPRTATTWYAPNQQAVHVDTLGPALVHSSGATAGVPGTWTAAGSMPPVSVYDLQQRIPVTIVANPTTTWTVGQYVQTGTAGTAGRAYWHTTTGWMTGAAP